MTNTSLDYNSFLKFGNSHTLIFLKKKTGDMIMTIPAGWEFHSCTFRKFLFFFKRGTTIIKFRKTNSFGLPKFRYKLVNRVTPEEHNEFTEGIYNQIYNEVFVNKI